jgi:hypothetical protein
MSITARVLDHRRIHDAGIDPGMIECEVNDSDSSLEQYAVRGTRARLLTFGQLPEGGWSATPYRLGNSGFAPSAAVQYFGDEQVDALLEYVRTWLRDV